MPQTTLARHEAFPHVYEAGGGGLWGLGKVTKQKDHVTKKAMVSLAQTGNKTGAHAMQNTC